MNGIGLPYNNDPICALSWKAPYAQLMLRGKIETRTWPTNYRGWVLICCSKAPYSASGILEIAGENQFNRILNHHPSVLNYQHDLGHAIAIGRLSDCRPMKLTDENAAFVAYKEPWVENKVNITGADKTKEKQLWCHIYTHIIPINPFPFKGAQGFKWLNSENLDSLHNALPDKNSILKIIQNDYSKFIQEYGFTEDQVQHIVQNETDFISHPQSMEFLKIQSSTIHGSGIFTINDIPENSVIGFSRIDKKRTELGRYINHSPFPNARFVAVSPDYKYSNLKVVTNRYISINEEITIDYRQAGNVNGYKNICYVQYGK